MKSISQWLTTVFSIFVYSIAHKLKDLRQYPISTICGIIIGRNVGLVVLVIYIILLLKYIFIDSSLDGIWLLKWWLLSWNVIIAYACYALVGLLGIKKIFIKIRSSLLMTFPSLLALFMIFACFLFPSIDIVLSDKIHGYGPLYTKIVFALGDDFLTIPKALAHSATAWLTFIIGLLLAHYKIINVLLYRRSVNRLVLGISSVPLLWSLLLLSMRIPFIVDNIVIIYTSLLFLPILYGNAVSCITNVIIPITIDEATITFVAKDYMSEMMQHPTESLSDFLDRHRYDIEQSNSVMGSICQSSKSIYYAITQNASPNNQLFLSIMSLEDSIYDLVMQQYMIISNGYFLLSLQERLLPFWGKRRVLSSREGDDVDWQRVVINNAIALFIWNLNYRFNYDRQTCAKYE